MNKYIVNIPEGYELDEEKSNFVFKKKTPELPESVEEIKDRFYYIDDIGAIDSADEKYMNLYPDDSKNHVSTKERAEAFLALIQLVELRDAWNNAVEDEWDDSGKKHVIFRHRGKMEGDYFSNTDFVLNFKTPELRDQFLEKFKDLIETAKELI